MHMATRQVDKTLICNRAFEDLEKLEMGTEEGPRRLLQPLVETPQYALTIDVYSCVHNTGESQIGCDKLISWSLRTPMQVSS
jgi:hypothetical protein